MVCFNLFVEDCIEVRYALLLVRKMFLLCEWNDTFSRFGLAIVINKCVIYLFFIQNREEFQAHFGLKPRLPTPFEAKLPPSVTLDSFSVNSLLSSEPFILR